MARQTGRIGRRIGAALIFAALSPSMASAEPRDLPVPPDKGWMHAETRLILRPQLAGLTRTKLQDLSADEHDVIAQFEAPDRAVFATLYLFHAATPSVPLWFDRARFEVEARDLTRHGAPASADPIAFAPAGTGPTSALRQAYGLVSGPLRSTEVAVMPLGSWLVVLRVSAAKLTADALDAEVMRIVAGLQLPAGGEPIAVPVQACAAPLSYGHAKEVKADTEDLLMSLVLSNMMAKPVPPGQPTAKAEPPAVWCREGVPTVGYAAYRANGDTSGYLLALTDAGRTVWVGSSPMSQIKKTSVTYAVALHDLEGATISFPSFDALPRPQQVFALVESGRSTGMARGNEVHIQAGALKP